MIEMARLNTVADGWIASWGSLLDKSDTLGLELGSLSGLFAVCSAADARRSIVRSNSEWYLLEEHPLTCFHLTLSQVGSLDWIEGRHVSEGSNVERAQYWCDNWVLGYLGRW